MKTMNCRHHRPCLSRRHTQRHTQRRTSRHFSGATNPSTTTRCRSFSGRSSAATLKWRASRRRTSTANTFRCVTFRKFTWNRFRNRLIRIRKILRRCRRTSSRRSTTSRSTPGSMSGTNGARSNSLKTRGKGLRWGIGGEGESWVRVLFNLRLSEGSKEGLKGGYLRN